ncbi:ATP-binding protein [Gemmatimonas sp.]|uniref:ATP-binding protein n=2 Tax=Gemmatimonas sp. TaxID=1962908 RepID=UPI00391EE236
MAQALSLDAVDITPAPAFLLRTFGTLELYRRDADPDTTPLLQKGKPLALLAYCSAERRRPHSRETLSALLWADAAPERARHNIRQAIWRLRRVLGDLLLTRDDAVTGVAAAVVTDRELFLDAVARQDHAEALRLYAGPFLDGVSLPGGDEFEDWAASERTRLEDTLIRAVEQAMRAEPPRIRPSERRGVAEALVARAPDAVDAHRLAIELHLESDDAVGARRGADQLEALAAREGRPLSAALQALMARTRAHHPPINTDDDLALDMVGRDEPFSEAMAAWARVKRGECRILLYTGVAGVGKTRLLRALADRCSGRSSCVLVVRAHPGEQALLWSFLVSLVRALAMQPGAAGIGSESARELVRLDPGLAGRFPASSAATAPAELTDSTRRRALALLDLVHAVAEQQPLALLVDDLHWMDEASRQALSFALTRVADVPLLVVGTARSGAPVIEHPSLETHHLTPLDHDAVIDAIRSAGTWPAEPVVEQFIHTLADSCAGIPLTLVERLALALETGVLQRREGTWSAPSWPEAIHEIAHASPILRRLRSCTPEERALLLMLTVAGTPVSPELLGNTPEERTLLRHLDAKGFVRRESGCWLPTHDVIGEQLRADAGEAAIRHAHARLATALEQSPLTDRLALAVRHFSLAGDLETAGTVFTRLVGRARAQHDHRRVHDLLADLVGQLPDADAARLVARVPWYHRVDRIGTRVLAGAAALLTIAMGTVAWRMYHQPALQVEQTSMATTAARLFGDSAVRLVPSPVVRIASRTDVVNGEVRVRALDGSARILVGDRVTTRAGVARFGGLRLVPNAPVMRLQFEGGGATPTIMTIRTDTPGPDGISNVAQLRLVEGRLTAGGRSVLVRGDRARIEVPPASLLDGVLQVEYASSWVAASVWLAMTPTWGDPRAVGRELIPLTTPVRWDATDVPIAVQTPSTAGTYWLLVVIGAEPSGGFLLSGTNWTVGAPVWGDGNDLATLPDSVIRAARDAGTVSIALAYPAVRSRQCAPHPDAMLRLCTGHVGLLAIEVIVK